MVGDRTLEPGKRLNIPERVRKRERQLRDPGSDLRQKLSEIGDASPIQPANENINTSTITGAISTYVSYILEDYLPVRFGADASVTNVDERDDGSYVYTIDVNAPFEGQAEFKAIMDAGTGASSLWVDQFEVEDYKVLKERPLRDTYRYIVRVDPNE